MISVSKPLMRRLALKALAFLIPLLGTLSPGAAAELVYVHESGCPYCRQWEREVGPVYDRTAEGRRVVLRRIEKRAEAVADLKLARPVRYTPTFVLIEHGAEVGRIEGYPGESFFWAMLGKLMDKLPRDTANSKPAEGVAGHISPEGAL